MPGLITNIYFKLTSFFSKGHQRSMLAKKNIAISFVLKACNILVLFLIVPITINYVNTNNYGVWLTLSSVISWFTFFDLGLGNGLKNKLVEAIAKGDARLGKIYVSTTYFIVSLIGIVLFAVFLVTNRFINWVAILNSPPGLAKELSIVTLIIVGVFFLQFVLQLVYTVSLANQNAALPSLVSVSGNVLGLLLVYIFTKTTHGSLLYLCLSIGVSPLIVLLIFSFILYNGRYKKYSPSLKFVRLKYGKTVFQLGVKFFIIQIGVLFFYNLDNILISHIAGPEAVTAYNIAFRYFGIITILSGIIMTPFWSAFGEAHHKNDLEWIKKSVKKLQKIVAVIFLLSLVMLFVSGYFYHIWIGNKVTVPFTLSAILAFYTTFNTFRTIFVYYINGVGKLNVQLFLVLISGLLNVPLGIWLGQIWGATGVVLSTAILSVCCCIVEIIQYKKLINNRAHSFWNK